MSQFPTLKTRRLVLRQPASDDVLPFFKHRADPKVNQYLSENYAHQDKQQTAALLDRMREDFQNQEGIAWVISPENSLAFIGIICLWNYDKADRKAEIGFSLNSEFHGKAFMSEALEAVLDHAFNHLHFTMLEAFTSQDNLPSIKLLRRSNFTIKDLPGSDAGELLFLTLEKGAFQITTRED